MHIRLVPILFSLACVGSVHPQVLVNEVMASNQGSVPGPEGTTPDWVELYNAGPRARDLGGWRLVLNDRQHPIAAGTLLPSGGHLLLWCDGRDDHGHAPFRLPREGGTLMLVDPSGTRVLDYFTYPALGADMAFGRLPDGSPLASFLPDPTPGVANPDHERLLAPVPAPTIAQDASDGLMRIQAAPGDGIRYTLDGSAPDPIHALPYDGPFPAGKGLVVRAIATRPGHLPSRVSSTTLPPFGANDPQAPVIMLVMDPMDLEGDEAGIDTRGLHANHSRSGRDWERPCHVELLDPDGTHQAFAAGVRVAGSGSRGSAKRSFKLLLKDRFGVDRDTFSMEPARGFDECLLRADAAPHSFLQHLLIEGATREAGLALDLQPSRPVRLVVNGEDRGLYRAMPPKDGQWLKSLHGAQDIDLLEGPAQVALEGDREHWEQALELLLSSATGDELDEQLDLASLVDLACLDLYTGRADHELNVRLWRPRVPGGRWRWVLFDLDLWAPLEENSVQRMGLAVVPATPYVPQLLERPDLQGLLLPRFAALVHGPLSPDRMASRLDSLLDSYGDLLAADHARWEEELTGLPDPTATVDRLNRFVEERPSRVMDHLARTTGHDLVRFRTTCRPMHGGHIETEGISLGSKDHSVQFAGLPLIVKAVPAEGWEFAGWKGVDAGMAEVRVDPASTRRLQAIFRPAGSGGDLP